MMNMFLTPEDIDMLKRLTMAVVLGGLIGLERESHGKDAGFRTHALVCVGASLFMIVSIEIHMLYRSIQAIDPSRIAAQVVSGIGFLGAGAIIRSPQQGIRGLTTAAGLWTAAGIGMACGLALYRPAILTTVLTLVILIIFSKINRWLDGGGTRKSSQAGD